MQIKNVREPNEEEKKSTIPKLITFGISTTIITLIIYIVFFNKDIGESLYIKENFLTMKTNAEHNAIIKLFEAIYNRDYMLSKLEGVSVSLLISVIANMVIPLIYNVERKIRGL